MVSDKPSTTPSTTNGGSGLPLWGEEPASPVVTDIFKLIADIEQQPGRHQEALQVAESHAYAMEMELQNCRTTQELSAKRMRELEEKLRATEDQVKDQKRVIDNLKEENVARDSRILDLEQCIRASGTSPNPQSTPMGTKAEEKKPAFPPTVKKKVSSLFRREGSNCQSTRRWRLARKNGGVLAIGRKRTAPPWLKSGLRSGYWVGKHLHCVRGVKNADWWFWE